MKSTIEKFRPIQCYEGLYQVSDYGTVRSLKFGKVRYFKLHRNKKGYLIVVLSRCANRKTFFVHRLVWEAFVGEIPNGLQIDHINGIKDDNRLDNLRLVTSKENSNNPITRERHLEAIRRNSQDPKWIEATREANQRKANDPKWLEANRESVRNSHNKPVLQLNKENGEVIREWECAADIERELGIKSSNISECCHGKLKSAGDFKWKFA